jgi:hypothetical protein
VAAVEVLHFLDNLLANRNRRDMVLSAAVSSGVITAVQAWPEYFEGLEDEGDPVFPSTGADMEGFELEEASPESFAQDIEAMVRAQSQVTVREEPEPEFPGLPYGLPDAEWT